MSSSLEGWIKAWLLTGQQVADHRRLVGCRGLSGHLEGWLVGSGRRFGMLGRTWVFGGLIDRTWWTVGCHIGGPHSRAYSSCGLRGRVWSSGNLIDRASSSGDLMGYVGPSNGFVSPY